MNDRDADIEGAAGHETGALVFAAVVVLVAASVALAAAGWIITGNVGPLFRLGALIAVVAIAWYAFTGNADR